MPYQLAKYSRAEFCATVRKHVLRLQAAKFSAEQIEAIEEEHGEFVRAYRNEEGLRNAIDACDHKTSFILQGWVGSSQCAISGSVRVGRGFGDYLPSNINCGG